MKWLQDNLLGMVLAATSGVFVLLALGMAIIWNLPVSVESAGEDSQNTLGNDISLAARNIGELSDYQVVNEKPVFNESRRPVISDLEDGSGIDDDAIEVKGAPDVKLTGVVITSNMKIASLTPADGNLETVMAHEGESLTGEFVGWQITSVNPRNVVLESRDGQSLELDLQVHDTKIQEPPKPVQPQKTTQAGDQDTEATGEDDEPLSRAEQIRQRIAERREELRLEQEAQQAQNVEQTSAARTPNQPSKYQQAVRELMNKKSKDQGSNDDEDG